MKNQYQRNVDGQRPVVHKIIDYVRGITRVDNEANPESALNKKKKELNQPINWQKVEYKQKMDKAMKNTKVYGVGWK